MLEKDRDENAIWPMPQFYFRVMWDSTEINFSEISGLDDAAQIQHDSGPKKLPGAGKVNTVSMKRGVFEGDNTYWDWFSKIDLNAPSPVRVKISLIDEFGKPTMNWTLEKAWPIKITSTGMKADDNSAAIDQLEVAYESLVIK